MKKIFLLMAINLVIASAMAQFKITLVMSTTPPAALSEWSNRREVLSLIVSMQGSAGGEAKIKTEIKTTDGTVIGTTDLAKARTVTFTTTNTILTANDVLPLDNMIFTGKYRSSLDKTGKLPSDNYTLCVQLVRPADYTPASEQQCKNFFLATLQLPILMKPYDEEKLDAKAAQTAITFRWTPVVPQQREAVTYHIQVFEVLDYQTPMQALRANQPLLDATVRGVTQYIWRPQLLFDETGGNQLKAQNNNTVKSNRGTEYRANNDNGEGDNMQLKAQNNNTVKSNRGTEYKINIGDEGIDSMKLKAQNNNTVKSNRGTDYKINDNNNGTDSMQLKIQNNNTVKSNRGTDYKINNNDDEEEVINKVFIWTIQTLDVNGNPIIRTDGNGEARSEPLKFYIVPKSSNQQKTKEKPIHGLKDTLKTQV